MKPLTMNLTATADRVGVSRRTLYYMMKDGRAPKPIKGTKPPRWDIESVDQWSKNK